MISRRELIASGVAASALSRVSLAAGDRTARAGGVIFVGDQATNEAREAARSAARFGAILLRSMPDVTSVYEQLDLELKTKPAVVAGITTPGTSFVLERLAWDHGLRTVFRGFHRTDRDRFSSESLSGSPAIRRRIQTEVSDGATLGRVLATTTLRPADFRHLVTAQHLPRNNDVPLVSWLLAPRFLARSRA